MNSDELLDKIIALAVSLGKAEEYDLLRTLCAAAAEELTALLRPGLTVDDCGGAFPLAAAWMALGALQTAGGDDVERLTAGDVTIQRSDSAQRRAALRLQAQQVMKPYLKDESFLFRGVAGW